MSVSRPCLILSVRGYDAKPVDGSDLGVDIRFPRSAYQVQVLVGLYESIVDMVSTSIPNT
jgi:hypothetical protein